MAKKKKGTVSIMRNVLVKKDIKKPAKTKKPKARPQGIGSFAGVSFHVKTTDGGNPDILTPADVSQEVSANWTDHIVIGAKYPKQEFLGSNTRSFSMTIVVDAMLGQTPHKVMKTLNKFCESGKVDELYIGKHKIGKKWKLESMSQAWDKIYSQGQLTKVTLSLTLSHYA